MSSPTYRVNAQGQIEKVTIVSQEQVEIVDPQSLVDLLNNQPAPAPAPEASAQPEAPAPAAPEAPASRPDF